MDIYSPKKNINLTYSPSVGNLFTQKKTLIESADKRYQDFLDFPNIKDIRLDLERAQTHIDLLMKEKCQLKNTVQDLIRRGSTLSQTANKFLQQSIYCSPTKSDFSKTQSSNYKSNEFLKTQKEKSELREQMIQYEEKIREQKYAIDSYKMSKMVVEKQNLELSQQLLDQQQTQDQMRELYSKLNGYQMENQQLKMKLQLLEEDLEKSQKKPQRKQVQEYDIEDKRQSQESMISFGGGSRQRLGSGMDNNNNNNNNNQDIILRNCTHLMNLVNENKQIKQIFNEKFNSNEFLLKLLIEKQQEKLLQLLLEFINQIIEQTQMNFMNKPQLRISQFQLQQQQQQLLERDDSFGKIIGNLDSERKLGNTNDFINDKKRGSSTHKHLNDQIITHDVNTNTFNSQQRISTKEDSTLPDLSKRSTPRSKSHDPKETESQESHRKPQNTSLIKEDPQEDQTKYILNQSSNSRLQVDRSSMNRNTYGIVSRSNFSTTTSRISTKNGRNSNLQNEKKKDRITQASQPLPILEEIPHRKKFDIYNRSSYNLLIPEPYNNNSQSSPSPNHKIDSLKILETPKNHKNQ